MQRFLMALALVAVAAVTYVATAPGGLRAGPSAKQFAALKKQVAALKKQVTTARKTADGAAGALLVCVMHQPVSVDQVGGSTGGYLYGVPTSSVPTSALNLAPSTETTPQHKFYELNTSNKGCVSLASSASTLTAPHAVAHFAGGR